VMVSEFAFNEPSVGERAVPFFITAASNPKSRLKNGGA